MKLPQKYYHPLRVATLKNTECIEQAEIMAKQYEDYFAALDKYSQMIELSKIDIDGWDSVLQAISND